MHKRVVHKIFTFAITPILCTALFIVPVHAESSIYYPDPSSYNAYNYFFEHGYNHLILSDSNNVTYNVSLDNYGTNNGTESGQEHTTGTINSNGSGTLGSKYMTCTTNTGTSASQTYSCYFSSSSYGVSNSQSINIGFNENTYTSVNNTINQTINTDITGTITSSNSEYFYSYLPWLNGTYTHQTSYIYKDAFLFNENRFYVIFFTNKGISNRTIDIYKADGNDNTIETVWVNRKYSGNMRLNVIKFIAPDNVSGNFVFDLPGLSNESVLPIYIGTESNMPDDIATLAQVRPSVGYILSSGNDNTSSSVSNATTANDTVNQKINSFDQIENNQINDMESKISDINVQSDLMSNNKFLSSAQWVKTQFDRMTVSTPIGSVLSFSLILGLALIFLGKIR